MTLISVKVLANVLREIEEFDPDCSVTGNCHGVLVA